MPWISCFLTDFCLTFICLLIFEFTSLSLQKLIVTLESQWIEIGGILRKLLEFQTMDL